MTEAAIFDVDGTLVDTNYLHAETWWEAFRQHGHAVDTRSDPAPSGSPTAEPGGAGASRTVMGDRVTRRGRARS
jgi:beta-phosphoglucomutase-like phosphatase (HAD superfamily)